MDGVNGAAPVEGPAAGPVAGGDAVAKYAQVIAYADDIEERPEQPFVHAYEDIENTLWIEDNPVYKAALAEWDRREKHVGQRLHRMEQRASELTNQVYQIVGFFAVFQSFAVSTVPQLLSGDYACGKIWFPIVLTVLASLVTIVAVWHKFENLKKSEPFIHAAKHDQEEAAARATSLRGEGPNFRFHNHAKESMLRPLKSKIWIIRVAIIFAIVVFSGIFIVSYFVIVCNSFVINNWKQGLPT